MKYHMQIRAAVESIGGQSENQFAVSESAPLRAAVEKVGVSKGRVKASLQPLKVRLLRPVPHT